MCLSRLHQVRSVCGSGKVLVKDMDGRRHEVSLLALEPADPEPGPGDWLVVHSGYAIDRADAREAETALAEIARGNARLEKEKGSAN
jgi:hydrogenase maturation factor